MRRWWQVVLAGGLALVALVVGIRILYWAIGPRTPAERSDFTRTALLIVITVVLAVGSYRIWQALAANQAVQQDTAQADRERERATRYTQAVAQLGSDTREVRLCGIY